MVSQLNTVFHILERYHPIPKLMRPVSWWEDMLEYLHNALADLSPETLEDDVGIGFGHSAARGVGEVGSENDVVERERDGRAMGQM